MTQVLLRRVVPSTLLFGVALVAPGHVPSAVQAVLVTLAMFVVPGLAFVRGAPDRNAVDVLFQMVSRSLLVLLVAWALAAVPAGPTSRTVFVCCVAVLTTVGWIAGARGGWSVRRSAPSRLCGAIAVIAMLFAGQEYVGAAHRVPALEDQDMETQGTAYALMHHGVPAMVTNRGTRYFFAHPPLLHFWIGVSALLSDDLDRLQHYDEAVARTVGATQQELDARFEVDVALFMQDPVLLPTRTPNVFLGALVLFPLGYVVYGLTRSTSAALVACGLYATFPEIYVRSAYGGYLAITNLLLSYGVYAHLRSAGVLVTPDSGDEPAPAGGQGRLVGVSLMAAWTDQKAVLVTAAAGIHAALRFVLDGGVTRLWQRLRADRLLQQAILMSSCFVVGWLGFAAYGMQISSQEFIADHIRGHVLDRLELTDVHLGTATSYPSTIGLWSQFEKHYGLPFFVAFSVACLAFMRRLRQADGVLLVWILLGAIGFSLVDWRQTKHLAHIVPALVIVVAVWWAGLSGVRRTAVTGLLGCALVWNVVNTAMQMADFGHIAPRPMW